MVGRCKLSLESKRLDQIGFVTFDLWNHLQKFKKKIIIVSEGESAFLASKLLRMGLSIDGLIFINPIMMQHIEQHDPVVIFDHHYVTQTFFILLSVGGCVGTRKNV